MLRAINIAEVEASIAHELGKETSIGGHTRDANTHMCINLEDFLLVHCQIVWTLFETDKDLENISWLTKSGQLCIFSTYDMSVRFEAQRGRSLLHSFLCIIDL